MPIILFFLGGYILGFLMIMFQVSGPSKLFSPLLCHTMLSLFSFFSPLSQILTGARLPRHEDWARAHHRLLHRCDVWGNRGQHPRERFSRGPQKALSKAWSLWKCLPQSVRTGRLPSLDQLFKAVL